MLTGADRDLQAVRYRLSRAVGVLALLFLVAAYAYTHLMPWSLLQALFFTLTTITTIGYNDYALTDEAKIFTMAVIVVGLATWTFIVAHIIELAVIGWQRWRSRQMERDLAAAERHFVVIGYGLVGRSVAKWLRRNGRTALVIDTNSQAVEEARADGLMALCGDATDEETLLKARIARADGLMAVTRSDPVNVFVTLTARELVPDLHICAAAMAPGSEAKLRRAGADAVVSPYDLGAHRLAMAAVSPSVAELMAGWGESHEAGLVVREAVVETGSRVCDQALRDTGVRQETGVLIAAVKAAADGKLVISPDPTYVLRAGDVVIGFGLYPNMAHFMEWIAPTTASELSGL
ncbi:MAG: TrkA family potassium uptake protein [Armatimonadetes bacterium]|nr:TrkA family potassium uptake protein [Armatimonadota bacterium]